VDGKDRKPGLPSPENEKRIIDVEKESLVVMAEALE